VALEAQACGTPVVAAAVGGLVTAVADGVSGVLIDGHDPARWARVIGDLLRSPARRLELARGAAEHAHRFSWDATASGLLAVYRDAMSEHRARFAAAALAGVS
jgi:D-inositol-3-phosphate glycosyltransferase